MGPTRLWTGLVCMAMVACSPPALPSAQTSAAGEHSGGIACPDGRAARDGLTNFGAYIGTWQQNRPHDRAGSPDYAIGMVQGNVAVRCSNDGFVIVEQIHQLFASPAGVALRVALTDMPDDSERVYDHLHPACRVLQYQSRKLAQQLGPDDPDGRVGIVLESDSGQYYSGAVKTIVLDLFDKLGADSRAC